MKKNRIYIGPFNTANVFSELEKSLRSVGLDADFIPWSNNQHTFYKQTPQSFKLLKTSSFKIFGKNIVSIINSQIIKPFYFARSLFKYDVFFFIKPTTFLRNNKDLFWLKIFGKKITFFYVGCNDRNPNFSDNTNYICNLCNDDKKKTDNNCNGLKLKKFKSQFFEKFSNTIFGFNDNVDFLQGEGKRMAIGMEDIKIPYTEKKFDKKLTILHLPSNPLMKGTDLIVPVLKKISSEEDVHIIIKDEDWSYEKMVDSLKEGHILVDSLASYTFGKMSLEAIQYGCVPLNAYPDWIAEYYEIPPVVKVDAQTLYQTLKKLINDRELLKQYAERSQNSFNKYFTYKAAGNYYKKELNLK